MVAKVKITDKNITVEVVNDCEKKETVLHINGYSICFYSKEEVNKFIKQIEETIRFWEF